MKIIQLGIDLGVRISFRVYRYTNMSIQISSSEASMKNINMSKADWDVNFSVKR